MVSDKTYHRRANPSPLTYMYYRGEEQQTAASAGSTHRFQKGI